MGYKNGVKVSLTEEDTLKEIGGFPGLSKSKSKSAWIGKVARHVFLLLFLSLTANLSGCAGLNTSKVPVGGVEIPFAVHQAGETVETDLQIDEDRSYTFALLLWFKNMSDLDYIQKLSWIGGGVAIHLSVELTGLDETNKSFVYSKKLYAGGRTASGWPKRRPLGMAGYHNRHIAYIRLKPGLYHVKVRSLDTVPELSNTPVSFNISYSPKLEKYK